MEHTVPVFLHHLCMNVETGITELGDFLGQELNPLSGVTEDDGLIDLKLNRKEKKSQCIMPSLWENLWIWRTVTLLLITIISLNDISQVTVNTTNLKFPVNVFNCTCDW